MRRHEVMSLTGHALCRMADIEWTKGEVKTAGFEHVEAKVYEHVQVRSGLAGCLSRYVAWFVMLRGLCNPRQPQAAHLPFLATTARRGLFVASPFLLLTLSCARRYDERCRRLCTQACKADALEAMVCHMVLKSPLDQAAADGKAPAPDAGPKVCVVRPWQAYASTLVAAVCLGHGLIAWMLDVLQSRIDGTMLFDRRATVSFAVIEA